MNGLCNDEVKKSLKEAANVAIIFLIFSNLGIVIGILAIINYFLGFALFPFSPAVDPPYMIVIFVVLSILNGFLINSLRKIKRKVCFSAELPMIN